MPKVCARGWIFGRIHRCTSTCIEIEKCCYVVATTKYLFLESKRKREKQSWCHVPSKVNVIKSAREFSGFDFHFGWKTWKWALWVSLRCNKTLTSHDDTWATIWAHHPVHTMLWVKIACWRISLNLSNLVFFCAYSLFYLDIWNMAMGVFDTTYLLIKVLYSFLVFGCYLVWSSIWTRNVYSWMCFLCLVELKGTQHFSNYVKFRYTHKKTHA